MSVNALMLSASRVGNTPYLSHTIDFIRPLCFPGQKWLFIPYAGVSMDYEHYLTRVQEGLVPLGLSIESIHQFNDPKQAVREADGIFVGGGNTFHLLHELYRYDLVQLINEQVMSGKPYVGWSAGANITGQSIRTTNDMPIIEPVSFTGLKILPFQLNPHYSNAKLSGHNGETRAQRLLEFTKVDPIMPVIAIQEGTALLLQDNKLTLVGEKEGYLFKGNIQEQPIAAGSDLSEYL